MALGRSLAPSPSVQEQRSVDFERVVANSLTVLRVEHGDEYHRVSFCEGLGDFRVIALRKLGQSDRLHLHGLLHRGATSIDSISR